MLRGCGADSHERVSRPFDTDTGQAVVIMSKQGISRHTCTATRNGHL